MPTPVSAPSLPAPPADSRLPGLDALRALAMLWMAGFHFAFDLNYFRMISPRQNFYTDPLWTTQRTMIVSLFLLCAGMGQAMAWASGQTWPRFWKRWLQIVACAAVVSAGSALMFPRSWIFFGVLHGMAVMLLIVRASLGLPVTTLMVLGLVALLLPLGLSSPVFDLKALSWIGLVTRKPVTEDFVPVLPWLGVMLAGAALGKRWATRRPAWLQRPLPRALVPLSRLGRWSLSFYVLHQPVLIGGILAVQALRGPGA